MENRHYFTASITDRGDEYFAQFTERHNELLTDQDAGTTASYVLVEEDGTVVGRFNLYRIQDGTAEVGYRIAEQIAGHGIASAAVRELCRLAMVEHSLSILRAATRHQNIASRRVLIKAGFVRAESAAPADIGGKQGHWYRRLLTPNRSDRQRGRPQEIHDRAPLVGLRPCLWLRSVASMPMLDLSGAAIQYSVRGAGPAVLIPCCNFIWSPSVVARLAQEHTVIVTSPRGFQGSGRGLDPYGATTIRTDLGGVLDHLGIDQYATFGYSMTGSVAP